MYAVIGCRNTPSNPRIKGRKIDMDTSSDRISPAITTTVDVKALILEQIAKTPGIRYKELEIN